MAVGINAEDDFSSFIDNLESITLHYRGSGSKVTIPSALRLLMRAEEAEPSGGAAIQSDALWHIHTSQSDPAPSVGDVLVDGTGNRWTILQLDSLSYLGRWKCHTRELRVAFGCNDRIDIQRAVWDDLGSGPEIVDWDYISTALPVRIQPQEIEVDDSVDPTQTNLHFKIILGEQISLQPDDRFVGDDGTVYQLVSLQQAERLDSLPIAQVMQVIES